MPIYEYACSACRHDFEFLLRGSEQPNCPQCGSQDLQRQLSLPAAHTAGNSTGELPVCQPSDYSGCGLPQCGTGGCQMQ